MRKRSNEKKITVRSKVIRYMRLIKRISQPVAAQAAGCSPAAIGHYENGRMDISETRARKLIACYGFDWEEFEAYSSGKPLPMLNLKDECYGLLARIQNEEKLKAVHTILASFIA